MHTRSTPNTPIATRKLSTVHSIENARAERCDPKYSPIISICKKAITRTVPKNKCLPLPTHTTLNRLACPKLKRASSYQNRIRKAVITINSGIIIKRNSFLGNNSISSVLVEPVMVPLRAAIIWSSAIPIRYIRHAVMKEMALITQVTNKQM